MNPPPTAEQVEQWRPLIRWVIGRLPAHVHARVDVYELEAAGIEGLIKAFRQYDPERGAGFKTYAVSRIRWHMYIAAGLTRTGWEPLGRLPDEVAS